MQRGLLRPALTQGAALLTWAHMSSSSRAHLALIPLLQLVTKDAKEPEAGSCVGGLPQQAG